MNIQVVNEVGVDLNHVFYHEHLHGLVQFISGLGPRKAKRLIENLRKFDKKLSTRGEILRTTFMLQTVYMSAMPFIKIKIPASDFRKTDHQWHFDILD